MAAAARCTTFDTAGIHVAQRITLTIYRMSEMYLSVKELMVFREEEGGLGLDAAEKGYNLISYSK